MKVTFARTAINHIAKIHDFIARENPQRARRVAAAIYRATDHLADFPFSGRLGVKPQTRELVVREYPTYIIVYRVLTGEDAVRIIAVFHAARNKPRGGKQALLI
jgi:toxin ParE1/3/4